MGRVATYVVMTALCALLLADTALAQDALLVSGRFYSASRNVGQDLGPAPLVRQSDIFGGGRYAILNRDVIDGRTGAIFSVFGQIIALDRARPRIFVRRETGVWAVDVASGAAVPMWLGDVTLVRQCALAYSSNELFCGVRRNDGLTDVVAINATTGSPLAIAAIRLFLTESFSVVPAWTVTSDGRRLYFGRDTGAGDVRLAVLDTTTGTITTSTAPGLVDSEFDGVVFSKVIVDEVNERLIVISGGITVLSKDLTVLGTANAARANLVISPHTGRLYLGQWQDCWGCGTLTVLDATTYASLGSSALAQDSTHNARSYMAVLTAPGAPKDLTTTVLGNSVLVSWTNVGGASGFVLDVGFAPGRTDLSAFLGPDAHVTFPNVPAGTYYLRVRGGNEHGGGRPSSEIRLVVP